MKKNKNTVKAINRNIRSSSRKVNNLLKNIRGKKVDEVIRDLSFARQRIAFDIKKTLECEECKILDESVLQNLIMTGFKICKSCQTSKTIFPV